LLLAIVFLTPQAGSAQGRTFFEVASQSRWQNLYDWPAAWCSLKIILLFCGVFSLVFALCAFWLCWMTPKFVGWVMLLITTGTVAGCWLGIYELIKAVF
jgi:hypothetical protein